jgi:hypothetical protein
MADLASPIQAFLAIDVITVAARPRFRTVCLSFAPGPSARGRLSNYGRWLVSMHEALNRLPDGLTLEDCMS